MRTILFLLQKEFLQIFRNRVMLPVIFVLPIVQLLILVHAATLEMKNMDLVVIDMDRSAESRKLTQKFAASPFFRMGPAGLSPEEARVLLRKGHTDLILQIPDGFGRSIVRGEGPGVQLLVDAINGTTAGISQAYVGGIIAGFNRDMLMQSLGTSATQLPGGIEIDQLFWYNPRLNYKIFMIPGIMVLLVTIIGMFLSALNLVREKEMGTIEQVNVSPIHKYQFITGKLIPFWIIALFELSFGLLIGHLVFDMPILGNLLVLFVFASVYLVAVMGLSLFISTMASTQQQVMFIGFFIVIVFILMSGIFTPTETMPGWAQALNLFNPVAYFMRVIRMIILKGSEMADIAREIIAMSIYAIVVMSLAVWRYRKVA